MKKSDLIRQKQADHIKNEIEILNMMKFPYIVNFKGIDQNEKYIYLGL